MFAHESVEQNIFSGLNIIRFSFLTCLQSKYKITLNDIQINLKICQSRSLCQGEGTAQHFKVMYVD
jgi:hypothetical protein